MLVVKIELWSARTGEHREIGRTYIWNKGGSHEKGDYGVGVVRRNKLNKAKHDIKTDMMRSGEVLNYSRLRYNVWRLVVRALKSAFPEENKK